MCADAKGEGAEEAGRGRAELGRERKVRNQIRDFLSFLDASVLPGA